MTKRLRSAFKRGDGSDIRLGARLAARYAPNQIFYSTLSWGPFMGVEQFKLLAQRFISHNIADDGDLALTREWVIHFVMEIIEGVLSNPDLIDDPGEIPSVERTMTLTQSSNWKEHFNEVVEWVSSLSIRLDVHDMLAEACDLSNKDLFTMLQKDALSAVSDPADVAGDGVGLSSCGDDALAAGKPGRKRDSSMTEQRISAMLALLKKKRPRMHDLVRWSDLTNNLVRDYEHLNDFGDDVVTYTQVFAKENMPRPSRNPGGGDVAGLSENTVQKASDSHERAGLKYEAHFQAPDHVLVAPLGSYIVTSSKDGFVKVWNSATGAFVRNLFNAGNSWIIGMYLLMDEDYILISTTNNQLTLLDFSSGDIVQKYVGCDSILTSFNEVEQLSAQDVQRYGMRPGECGAYRIRLRENEQAKEFHQRRREAHKDVFPKRVLAKPVVGFLSPTATWFEPHSGMFCFGTAEGSVGAFDVSADVRPSALLCGANSKPVRLTFLVGVHKGMVTGMFYSSYTTSIFTAGMDGCIYRLPMGTSFEPIGEPRRIGHQLRAIRSMDWTAPSKYFTTVHVNRRITVWAIGRHGEPFRSFPPETQEIVSVSMHPHKSRLAVLLADKTIKVYEIHASKSVTVIPQPLPELNFTSADSSRQMIEQSKGDPDGVVSWHPFNYTLICGLRGVVLYAPLCSKDSNGPATQSVGRHADVERATGMEAELAPHPGGEVTIAGGPPNTAARQDCLETSHGGGVVSTVLHRQSLTLHTFDEGTWCVWDPTTGKRKRRVDTFQAVRAGDIPRVQASIASCSWSTSAQFRLVTGCQDCSLITWDPETCTPLESEVLEQDSSEQTLDSDVFVFSHQSKLIAWVARTCRVTAYNRRVLPSGVEDSTSTEFRVPALASVTACSVVHDNYLCLGTGDGMLYLYSIRGGQLIHECMLRDKNEEDRGAVVQIMYFNEQGQNLITAVADTGFVYLYSFVNKVVLGHVKLFHRFDCRIRKALCIVDESLLICGDSKGRVSFFDLHTSSVAVTDLRQFAVKRFIFHGASDEITSLELFSYQGNRFIVVGSLDRQVRLFRVDESLRTTSLSISGSQGIGRSVPPSKVVLVGVFGRDEWDINNASTFASDRTLGGHKHNVQANVEEAVLDSIIRPDGRTPGILSGSIPSTDDSLSQCLLKVRRVSTATTPNVHQTSSCVPSFFLTESPMATCEGPPPTTSTFSTAESMEQPPQQHGLPQLTATTFPDGSSFSATQLSDNTCVAPGKLRRSASQTRTHTLTSAATNVCGDNSPAHTEVYSMIDSGTTETRCNASSRHSVKSHISSEATEVNWAKAALLSLTVRLDRVRPLGHVRGAFTRQLQGILPEIGHSAGGVDTPTGEPSNSDALRLALETRRRLAERVDEYKRRREEMKKRRKLDCTSCFSRSILPPVVIPKPTIISDELLPIADWLIEGTKKQTQLKPSVTASIVGESM